MPHLNSQKGFVHLVIILLFLVAAVFGGYYFYITKIQPQAEKPIALVKPPVISKITAPLTLTLESPTDKALITSYILTIKGKTLPNTPVAFYTDTDQNSVESDANGSFEGTLQLTNGLNYLTVTAYGDNGEEKTIFMDVVSET